MNERRLPYIEGTWFAVPLRTSGYGLGVLARVNGRGLAFGYFFGPRRDVIPDLDNLADLKPRSALLATIFGDLGLLEGKWPVIGRFANWDRDQWPLPSFGRVDETVNKAWLVTYSADLETATERPCLVAEAKILHKAVVSGYGSVEKRLTRMLDNN